MNNPNPFSKALPPIEEPRKKNSSQNATKNKRINVIKGTTIKYHPQIYSGFTDSAVEEITQQKLYNRRNREKSLPIKVVHGTTEQYDPFIHTRLPAELISKSALRCRIRRANTPPIKVLKGTADKYNEQIHIGIQQSQIESITKDAWDKRIKRKHYLQQISNADNPQIDLNLEELNDTISFILDAENADNSHYQHNLVECPDQEYSNLTTQISDSIAKPPCALTCRNGFFATRPPSTLAQQVEEQILSSNIKRVRMV